MLDSFFAGHAAGLISAERWAKYLSDRDAIQHGTDFLKSIVFSPQVRKHSFVLYDLWRNVIALGEVRCHSNQRRCHEEAHIYQHCPAPF